MKWKFKDIFKQFDDVMIIYLDKSNLENMFYIKYYFEIILDGNTVHSITKYKSI